MKLLIILMSLLITVSAIAGDIRLTWDANDEPTVTGYNVYWRNHINENYKLMSEIFEQDFDNPLFPEIGVWGLSNSLNYYFVATAFSTDAESGHSNEVLWSYTAPAPKPDSGGGGGGCFISTVGGTQ